MINVTFLRKISDAKWGRWSSWSDCTKTCGNGTRFRRRTCATQNQPPFSAPISCAGKPQQISNCAQWKCPGQKFKVHVPLTFPLPSFAICDSLIYLLCIQVATHFFYVLTVRGLKEKNVSHFSVETNNVGQRFLNVINIRCNTLHVLHIYRELKRQR